MARAVAALQIRQSTIGADRVRVEEGSAGPGGPFQGTHDLVLANIIARILVELAPGLAATVAPSGALVLSGIIEAREPAVRRAFAAEGLVFAQRSQIEDWVALVYRQPDAAGVPRPDYGESDSASPATAG